MTTKKHSAASLSSIGGSSNEIGAHFRATIAAWAAAHGLLGHSLPLVPPQSSSGVPHVIRLETGNELDDVSIEFTDGRLSYIQAKHSVTLARTSKPMQSALQQWKSALGNSALDADRTRLVLAVAHPNPGIRALATALERLKREHTGSLSGPEARALAQFRQLLKITEEQFVRLTRMATIAELPSAPGVASIEHVSAGLLDGRVVAPGQGDQAWTALVEHARELARRRDGDAVTGWLDALRRNHLDLVVDAQKSFAATLEVERLAVQHHRERLVTSARTLDLRGLGVSRPPIDVHINIGRIRVQPLDPDTGHKDSELPLAGALRRRGHSLLVGPPGAGKSTALAQAAAEWARYEDSPLPILVRLTDFLHALSTRSPLDALLVAATQETPADEHSALRSAVERAIRVGNVALFLDALDETREQRFTVVRQLHRLLSHELARVPEVVISTRDSAYADANTLGMKSLKTLPPKEIDSFVLDLLTAMAVHDNVDASSRSNWVLVRALWVKAVMTRDPSLRDTPLMPLLLVLLAAESPSGVPPTGRAEVLGRVVENIVRRWEIRQRRTSIVRIGPLEGEAATSALLQAFTLLGWLLVSANTLRGIEAEDAVALAFRTTWELAPGHASVAAREALHFWDEAGVYVFNANGDMLSARVTLLSEIGAARHLSSLPPPARMSAVDHLSLNRTARTTLSLAMSADAEVTAELIRAAVDRADTDLLLWCMEQVRAGAMVQEQDLASLVMALLKPSPVSNSEAWVSTKSLCRTVTPQSVEVAVRAYLAHLRPSQRVIADAMTAVRDGRQIQNLELVLTAIAHEVEPSEPMARPTRAKLSLRTKDNEVQELAIALAERQLKTFPQSAGSFAEIAKRCSHSTQERLYELLAAAGRRDLWPKGYGQFLKSLGGLIGATQESHDIWKQLLAHVAAFAPPCRISLAQARRMDELADYVATLQYGQSTPKEISQAFRHEPELAWILQTTAKVAGFDLSILAREAEIALQMEAASADTMSFLFDSSTARELVHWSGVTDQEGTVGRLASMVASQEWVCEMAVSALEHTPLKVEAATSLQLRFRTYQPYQRLNAAWLITILQPEDRNALLSTWKSDSDPILRRVAAKSLGRTTTPDQLAWAFFDPDASVRADAVAGVTERNDIVAFADLLTNLASSEAVGWLCLWCGTLNDADGNRGCRKCSVSAPDARLEAQRALTELKLPSAPPQPPSLNT